MPYGRRSKYVYKRLRGGRRGYKKVCARGSIRTRTVKSRRYGRVLVRVCCPKGQWSRRRQRCRRGMRGIEVLKPKARVLRLAQRVRRRLAANPQSGPSTSQCMRALKSLQQASDVRAKDKVNVANLRKAQTDRGIVYVELLPAPVGLGKPTDIEGEKLDVVYGVTRTPWRTSIYGQIETQGWINRHKLQPLEKKDTKTVRSILVVAQRPLPVPPEVIRKKLLS